jgi:hypothetical protein
MEMSKLLVPYQGYEGSGISAYESTIHVDSKIPKDITIVASYNILPIRRKKGRLSEL